MANVDIQLLHMVEKCIVNFMKENDYLKKISHNDMVFLEESIGRALQEYKQLDISDYSTGNDIQDRIRIKEKEVEINMSVREPDMYYMGNWLECWKKQEFLRNEEWLRDIENVDDVLTDQV